MNKISRFPYIFSLSCIVLVISTGLIGWRLTQNYFDSKEGICLLF